MALFQPKKQGLMMQPAMQTMQGTTQKPAMQTMQDGQMRPRNYSLMSEPKFAGDKFGLLKSPELFSGSQKDYEDITGYAQTGGSLTSGQQQMLQSAGGLRAPNQPAVSYGGGAMSAAPQEATVTSSYRAPLISRVESVVNPFGAEYLAAREADVVNLAEQQAAAARERTGRELGQAGIMRRRGVGGLETALMARAAQQAEAAKSAGIRDVRTGVAQQAAEFDIRQSQLIDAYKQDLARQARELALLPAQVRLGEAQAESQKLQAEALDLENAVKRYTPEQQAQIRDSLVKSAIKKGEIDEITGNALMRELDPTAWWNSNWWRALKSGTGLVKDLAEIIGVVSKASAAGGAS